MEKKVCKFFTAVLFFLMIAGCSDDDKDKTPVCGNDVVEEGEVCDGTDLQGESCASQGFYSGTLACLQDCSGFDTTGCEGYCGDGMINGDEVCDGDETGGETCEDQGFDGGTLGCSADCSEFDTTTCWTCGDGVCDVELGENVTNCPADCSVASISAGASHTCAVKSNGDVYCWGLNYTGQLGDGTDADRRSPVKVHDLEDADYVFCGNSHSCALMSDGTAQCWGSNSSGQLGDGTTTDKRTPVEVLNLTNITGMSGGGSHTCAATSNGAAWCWGTNQMGQLGDGTSGVGVLRSTPVQVVDISNIGLISAGGYHTCAMQNDGTSWCWGDSEWAQLGDGTSGLGEHKSSPVQVEGLEDIDWISGEGAHTCAVKNDGTVWCWGWNQYGQIGDGNIGVGEYVVDPFNVDELDDVAMVSSGYGHTCALKNDGTIWCWGWNSSGQLGDGTNTDRTAPVQVQDLTDVAFISSGDSHTCAITNAGVAYCWGANQQGQLGDNTNQRKNAPVEIVWN